MKRLIYVIVCLLVIGQIDKINAQDGARFQLTVRVVDEKGSPVENARVFGGAWNPHKERKPNSNGQYQYDYDKETDTNGVAIITGMGYSDANIMIEKEKHYRNEMRYFFRNKANPGIIHGCWQPWNPTIEVVLKRIRNPIPMYAKRVNLGMPAMEKPVGFDLMVGDWVQPHGNGIVSDFVCCAELKNAMPTNAAYPDEFDYKLTISVSNEKDGLQKMEMSGVKSQFKSKHEAPSDLYLKQWIQRRSRQKGQHEKTNIDYESGYYFRVRSKIDEKGELKSALYGKVYGDFLNFTYYLNPTPNDRNVEFDPKQNLFTNLGEFEQVHRP